jgi:hypothetical protein
MRYTGLARARVSLSHCCFLFICLTLCSINIALHVIELRFVSDYNSGLNSIFSLIYCALFGKMSVRADVFGSCALVHDLIKHIVLKLAVLQFLLSSLLSQTAPAVRTRLRAHIFGSRALLL